MESSSTAGHRTAPGWGHGVLSLSPTAAAPQRIAIVSTYPPRACGIGTFSRDLREALGSATDAAVDVVAIVRDGGATDPAVVARIRQDVRGDYVAAARALGRRGTDAVVVQHEYGIFGGQDGAYVLSLAEELRLPLVVTLHTVLGDPSPRQAQVLAELCARATLVTVFTETARDMVVQSGTCADERVRIVPHGGPTVLLPHARNGGPPREPLPVQGASGSRRAAVESVAGRRVLATFGLISPGKGIEVAIAAMPAIVAEHPDALLLIAGQTHPEIVKQDGERYRLSLERQARDLGLLEHVHFDDRFLSVDELATLLAATDVYLTPYRSVEQIVSGALTFAIVAGRPVVSTPYRYAVDLLADGAGVLVPFDDPPALAAAVNGLLDDPARLAAAGAAAARLGATMTWPAVGRRMAGVLSEALAADAPAATVREEPTRLPQLRPDHLLTLVDDVGIIEHADGVMPSRRSGYCVDDVARLAIVAVGLRRITGEPQYRRMLLRALGFLRFAWNPEAGAMHNRLSYDRRWLDEPHLGDHVGRAAWALGEVLAADEPVAVHEPVRLLLTELLPALQALEHPRSQAYAVLGLSRAAPASIGEPGELVLRELAGRLLARFEATRSDDWPWFLPTLAYDDARLAQALIAAAPLVGDQALLQTGLRTLAWLGDRCGLDGDHVVLTGGASRGPGVPIPPPHDEQPLDASALAEAEVEAFAIAGHPAHARRATRAFEWFLGANHLGIPVYDFATGGCHDGLGRLGVNHNQGAESTLAYLQALIAIDASGVGATIAAP